MDCEQEAGISFETDFCDRRHLNVHGGIKFTEYVSKYLIEHYGFEDKRGVDGYESWDLAAKTYDEKIAPWCLDFERAHAERDDSMAAPELQVQSAEEMIELSWTPSAGAEQYAIYRKSDAASGEADEEASADAASGESGWEQIGLCGADVHSYRGRQVKEGASYTYTVVPVREGGQGPVYGRFLYQGVPVTLEQGS